jgi:hypothetical protein
MLVDPERRLGALRGAVRPEPAGGRRMPESFQQDSFSIDTGEAPGCP